MTYVHITRSQGQTVADYESVLRALGGEPIRGRVSHHVGETDGSLCIVDVWDSRADADRFATERLFPAFQAAGVHPQPSTLITAFDAVHRG